MESIKNDLDISYRSLNKLVPYANNARTHSDEQVAQIAASIQEFGWTNPVLLDGKCGIIAGHGRVLAARKLGMETVPCIDLSHLSKKQKQAYVLADNKLALNAGWSDKLLALELGELVETDFDIELTGFSQVEIDALLAEPTPLGNTDEDETPGVEDEAVTQMGDIWQLGNHRVICGDSCDSLTVEKVLDGVQPHLMVTDPPYGVAYNPSWRAEAGVNRNQGKMGKVINDDRFDWRDAWALFPGEVAYIWHSSLHTAEVLESLRASNFEQRSMIIWAKERFALSRGHYHWQHEPCWYVVRKGGKARWCGDRTQSTVWKINAREDGGIGHGTQKPVECMRRPMENNSSPGQAVYEPFLGSGTSIIAAETCGRICYAVEINPLYVDMAIKRWQDFTGEKAINITSRLGLNEVKQSNGSSEL